jgi:hypothetical protein
LRFAFYVSVGQGKAKVRSGVGQGKVMVPLTVEPLPLRSMTVILLSITCKINQEQCLARLTKMKVWQSMAK